MKSVGVFDILGPIMIGPSSSHTAGAARLGKIARAVAGGDIKKVIFLLHGSINVTEVNGSNVEFTGAYPTLVISHMDVPGVVSQVTALLFELDINIAFMKVIRSQKGKEATMVFELDGEMTEEAVEQIKSFGYIKKVIMINPIKDGE